VPTSTALIRLFAPLVLRSTPFQILALLYSSVVVIYVANPILQPLLATFVNALGAVMVYMCFFYLSHLDHAKTASNALLAQLSFDLDRIAEVYSIDRTALEDLPDVLAAFETGQVYRDRWTVILLGLGWFILTQMCVGSVVGYLWVAHMCLSLNNAFLALLAAMVVAHCSIMWMQITWRFGLLLRSARRPAYLDKRLRQGITEAFHFYRSSGASSPAEHREPYLPNDDDPQVGDR
jgi:hypothetical protein